MSESEDEIDEITQMLMKSSTKHFNHVNCGQSTAHSAMLFQARPMGQSRITKEQSFLLRTNSALSRLQKNDQLVRKLNKECSKATLLGGSKRTNQLVAAKAPSQNDHLRVESALLTSYLAKSNARRRTAPHLGLQKTTDADFQDPASGAARQTLRLQTMRSFETRYKREVPGYVWHVILQHMDLKFVLARMMSLSVKTREYFCSLNSTLFDSFISSYGLSRKLRRTDLPGRIQLVPFLTKLEQNMVRASFAKAKADRAY